MPRRYDTVRLGDAQRSDAVLYIDCRHCRRYRLIFARALQDRPELEDRLLSAVPFRCQHCQQRPYRVRVFLPQRVFPNG